MKFLQKTPKQVLYCELSETVNKCPLKVVMNFKSTGNRATVSNLEENDTLDELLNFVLPLWAALVLIRQ